MTSTSDQPGCLWPEQHNLRTPQLKEQVAIQVRTAREAIHCGTRYGLEASTRSAAQIVCRNRNNV